jgi:hypothetical protein
MYIMLSQLIALRLLPLRLLLWLWRLTQDFIFLIQRCKPSHIDFNSAEAPLKQPVNERYAALTGA